MKRSLTLLFIIVSFILAQSCSKDNSFSIPLLNGDPVYMTRGDGTPTVCQKVRFFSINDIPDILHGWMDPNNEVFDGIDREKYSVITVSEEGYNLIYVVNFDDGGWVLISAIMLDNGPILGFSGKSDITQYYDPNNIKAPAAIFLFESYKSYILKKIKESMGQ